MESGTEEFTRLTLKAAELKDKMADVNEQINVFASGSKYEQVSNSLGEIGSAIVSLDFEKAQERAGAFAKAAGNISFGDAIQSVKQLGTTFMTLGKALLTNPLFLLAAVIIAIVVAVVKLLDKMGVLKKIMDAIDMVIGVVVQGLKDFADWIGITDFAGEEAAENESKRLADLNQKRAKAAELFILQQKGIIAGLDNEIAVRRAQGKETADLEREKLNVIRSMAEAELKIREIQAIAVAKLMGENSLMYQQTMMQIEEARQGFDKAQADIDAFEAGLTTKRVQAAQQRNEKLKAEEKKYLDEIEKLRLLRLQQEQDLYTQIEALENEYFNSKLDKEQQEINSVREKYFAIIEMAREAAEQMKASATNEDEIAAAEEMIARAATLEEAQQAAILEIQKRYQEERDAMRQQEDANIQESNNERLKWADMSWEQQAQMVSNYAGQASQFLGAIASLQQTNLDNQIKAAAGNEAKQEKLRKEGFEKNKKMQIAMAVINAAQGVLSAIASPFPLNIGLAVIAAATGIASIAKIASTTYQGGGGGGGVSAPNMSSLSSSGSGAMPSFNLFGTGGNSTQQAGTQSVESNVTVQAVVSETEITETQGKVNKYQQNAEL
jgi:hypothetical protein